MSLEAALDDAATESTPSKILRPKSGPPTPHTEPIIASLPIKNSPSSLIARKSPKFKPKAVADAGDALSFAEWVEQTGSKIKSRDRRSLRHDAAFGTPEKAEEEKPAPLVSTSSAAHLATVSIEALAAAELANAAGVANRPINAENPLTWKPAKTAANGKKPTATPKKLVSTDGAAGAATTAAADDSPNVDPVTWRPTVATPSPETARSKGSPADRRRGSAYKEIRPRTSKELMVSGHGVPMTMEEWTASVSHTGASLVRPPSLTSSSGVMPTFNRKDSVWRSFGGGLGGFNDAIHSSVAVDVSDADDTAPAAGLASINVHRDVNPISWQPVQSAPARDRAHDSHETGLFRRGQTAAAPGHRPASARGSMF